MNIHLSNVTLILQEPGKEPPPVYIPKPDPPKPPDWKNPDYPEPPGPDYYPDPPAPPIPEPATTYTCIPI